MILIKAAGHGTRLALRLLCVLTAAIDPCNWLATCTPNHLSSDNQDDECKGNGTGLLRRCYQCRSRGELGNCKDPFKLNATLIDNVHGVTAVPCASGWCGKVIEGEGSLRDDDYDMATQRMCVQRGPSDSEDRCAYTVYNYKKVYMCFCQGDLCNAAQSMQFSSSSLGVICSIALLSIWYMGR